MKLRQAISSWLVVGVIVLLVQACLPFVKTTFGTMLTTYENMADNIMIGSGGEYAESILNELDSKSQTVLGELGSWANDTVEQSGGKGFLESLSDIIGDYSK